MPGIELGHLYLIQILCLCKDWSLCSGTCSWVCCVSPSPESGHSELRFLGWHGGAGRILTLESGRLRSNPAPLHSWAQRAIAPCGVTWGVLGARRDPSAMPWFLVLPLFYVPLPTHLCVIELLLAE